MTSRIHLNTYLLPVLVIALIIMQLIDPSKVWTILLVGLGGVWIIAFTWTRSLAHYLKFSRVMRYGWVQVGDSLEEHFTLENESKFPATWVEIQDHSTLPGYHASLATGVDGSSINEWNQSGTCIRRGIYQLGNTSVRTGDPFGIYTVNIIDTARTFLTVLPPVVSLPGLDIASGGPSGAGHPLPNAPEHTVDASSVREYIPGDSFRLIHWKSTARFTKPFVRLFDGSPASDWWIMVDLQDEVQIGSGEDSTEEHSIILAASLADRGLRTHHEVGLIINGQRFDYLPPRTGANQRWDILRTLALASRGETSLGKILERLSPNLGRNASLMIITPTTKIDWLKSLVHLRWRGIVPTILLLNTRSFGAELDNQPIITMLQRTGIAHHHISRELLNRPEAHPGTRGQWEWRMTPTGKSIPIRAPDDVRWRKLSE
jgi:uncharacterized protein (DUF58 family)